MAKVFKIPLYSPKYMYKSCIVSSAKYHLGSDEVLKVNAFELHLGRALSSKTKKIHQERTLIF
jgi:hypothetical protein